VVKSPLVEHAEKDRDALYRTGDALLVRHVGEAEEVAQAYLYLMNRPTARQRVTVDGGGAGIAPTVRENYTR